MEHNAFLYENIALGLFCSLRNSAAAAGAQSASADEATAASESAEQQRFQKQHNLLQQSQVKQKCTSCF